MKSSTKFALILCLLAHLKNGYSQTAIAGFDPSYQIVKSGSFVQDKNFYLLTLLQTGEASSAITQNAYLSKLLHEKDKLLDQGVQSCSLDVACHADLFLWKDEEIEAIGKELRSICRSPSIREMISEHMRPSGMFQKFSDQSDEELLTEAWKEAARGINYVINTYSLAGEQRYPKIDSVSYDIDGQFYKRLILSATSVLWDNRDEYSLFFQPSLDFALTLLDLNDRDEGGRYEPMEQGENRLAVERIPKIQWDNYKYSIILVPGYGPEEPTIQLSPGAKLRNRLAADRYHQGWAPFVVVSGGNVHPFQTPYNEAIEMKKDLMERYDIPESAILIEPHARHTTTNFRNAARLIYRYGIPSDKMAMVTTSLFQSYYITDMNLDQRCEKELGYVPFKLHQRLSKFDVEWKPDIMSLHADPMDPLDP